MLSFLTKNRASRLLHTLLITPSCDLFFPPRCFICENRLTLNQKIVCLSCLNNIPLYHTPPQNPFPDKIFNRAYILFTFNQDIRLLIHLFKYKGYFTLADYFAETAIRIYPQLIQTRYDFVLPVPLHKTRYRERGFNQSTVLGRALANLINVDLNENLLIRHRNTPTQTHLDRRERQQNVASAFQCTAMLPDIRILIIDDVITTGSTLNACCMTLQKAGAAHVDVFALANPVLDKPNQYAEG
jgi:ComF family protein